MNATGLNEDIIDWCRKRLEEEPGVGREQLYEESSQRFGKDVTALSPRQFYARYPLQVKRSMAREGEARAAEEEMEDPISTEDAAPWPMTDGAKPEQTEMFAREDGGMG